MWNFILRKAKEHMQDFRKLEAWQKSHAVVLRTYAVTANFPKTELFGLTPQMRRASASIAANIAEGCYRGQRSLAHSLTVALGSAGELEYFVILAGDLKLLSDVDRTKLARDVSDVKAVVTGLLKAVKASIAAAKKANGKRPTVNGKR
jgi:four helix bundle protein